MEREKNDKLESTVIAFKRRYQKEAQRKATVGGAGATSFVRSPPSSSSSPKLMPSSCANMSPSTSRSTMTPFHHHQHLNTRNNQDEEDDGGSIHSTASERSIKERLKKLGRPFKPLRKLIFKKIPRTEIKRRNMIRPAVSGKMAAILTPKRDGRQQLISNNNMIGSLKTPTREPSVEHVAPPPGISSRLPPLVSSKAPPSIPETITFPKSAAGDFNHPCDRDGNTTTKRGAPKKVRFGESPRADSSHEPASSPYVLIGIAGVVIWATFGILGAVVVSGAYFSLSLSQLVNKRKQHGFMRCTPRSSPKAKKEEVEA